MAILERTIFRPFKMLLVERVLVLATVYLSVAYSVIYASPFFFIVHQVYPFLTIGCAVFQALPVIFIRTRHFCISNDDLVFIGIGIGIGSVLAALVNVWFL